MAALPSRPPPSAGFLERKGAGGAQKEPDEPPEPAWPATTELVRHYSVWPTRNVFCCGGRLMTGPVEDIGPNYCAWGLVLTPMGTFLYVWGPAVVERSILHLLVTLAFFASTIVWFLVTGFADPGIIKRADTAQFADSQPHFKEPSIKHETEDDGSMVTHTWCHTCHIYRPPRASHCADCDNCVREFDHHCPFTRNCIGARNYPFFLTFLVSCCLALADVGASCMLLPPEAMQPLVVDLAPDGAPGGAHAGVDLAPLLNVLLIGYCGLLSLLLWAFTGYHLSLVISGLTTKEHLKGRHNPLTRSFCARLATCGVCAVAPSELGTGREFAPRRLVSRPKTSYEQGYSEAVQL
jgi:hypothetical protein